MQANTFRDLDKMENKTHREILREGLIDALSKAADETTNPVEQLMKTASYTGDNALLGETIQPPYANPFISLSDMKTPNDSRDIFYLCKYFYDTDALITGAINALATFPITEIFLEEPTRKIDRNAEKLEEESEDDGYEEDSDKLKTYRKVLFEKIGLIRLLVEVGIDYWLYGNCFIMGDMAQNKSTGEWEWDKVSRIDPTKIDIDVNPENNSKIYKLRPSEKLKHIVTTKEPANIYNELSDKIKQAVTEDKSIILDQSRLYHFKRPSDSLGDSNAWGVPVVFNALKILMYKNTLRQAQEAIAKEHIVPFRVYYLNPVPGININANWEGIARDFSGELLKTVRDPNYKVVSPVPVNQINSGGDGRALLLVNEISQIQDEILAAMNCPREFVFGGTSYSSSSIALKVIENQFLTYRGYIRLFVKNFLIKEMAKKRGEWKDERDDETLIDMRMVDMKVSDDVQQKQMMINMNSTGKVSDDYTYKMLGMDAKKMKLTIKEEALAKIETDTDIQIAQIKAQTKLQKEQMMAQREIEDFAASQGMTPPMPEGAEGAPQEGQPPQEGMPQEEQAPQEGGAGPTEEDIFGLAQSLSEMPKGEIDRTLASMNPEHAQMVMQAMNILAAQSGDNVDDRPMPEKLPPRRAGQ